MKLENWVNIKEYIGDRHSLFYADLIEYKEGPSRGMQAVQLFNGKDLHITFLVDRGLDIPYLSYKGMNIALVGKVGLRSPYLFTETGARGFLRQFNAGFLTSCGMVHSGVATDTRGLHGVLNETMAESLSKTIQLNTANEYEISLKAELREAVVFGENILLKRQYIVSTEHNSLILRDEYINEGFLAQEIKPLYHFNFGYPFLNEHCHIESSATELVARDEEATSGIASYRQIEKPRADYREQCFFLKNHPTEAWASLINDQLNIKATIHFNSSQCPALCVWKNMRSGDYGLGLEPYSPSVFEKEPARLIPAQESFVYEIKFEIEELND